MSLSLDTARLPGVGRIIDPQPADYRASIRFLEHGFVPVRTSRRSLCDRLKATARRLEWAP